MKSKPGILISGLHGFNRGMAQYTHLIRASDDPKPRPRAERKGHQMSWLKDMNPNTLGQWTRAIYGLLADGVPRTFNRIVLELTGNLHTADVAFKKAPDQALWNLVARRKISHTLEAPILFGRSK